MSETSTHTDTELAARIREVLKDHQRDGMSMIGNVDKLVGSLVRAVHDWIEEERNAARKSA